MKSVPELLVEPVGVSFTHLRLRGVAVLTPGAVLSPGATGAALFCRLALCCRRANGAALFCRRAQREPHGGFSKQTCLG